jgi:hypothetical protein
LVGNTESKILVRRVVRHKRHHLGYVVTIPRVKVLLHPIIHYAHTLVSADGYTLPTLARSCNELFAAQIEVTACVPDHRDRYIRQRPSA